MKQAGTVSYWDTQDLYLSQELSQKHDLALNQHRWHSCLTFMATRICSGCLLFLLISVCFFCNRSSVNFFYVNFFYWNNELKIVYMMNSIGMLLNFWGIASDRTIFFLNIANTVDGVISFSGIASSWARTGNVCHNEKNFTVKEKPDI